MRRIFDSALRRYGLQTQVDKADVNERYEVLFANRALNVDHDHRQRRKDDHTCLRKVERRADPPRPVHAPAAAPAPAPAPAVFGQPPAPAPGQPAAVEAKAEPEPEPQPAAESLAAAEGSITALRRTLAAESALKPVEQ